MQFLSGYDSLNDMYGAMDRGLYQAEDPDSAGSLSNSAPGAADLGIGIGDIGMSVPMGISAPNVQGIYSKIRSGLSKMEIGFPGAISGNRQAHTPEMYGKDQRQAMRELADINEVEFTTHSAYQMMGMTGAIEQGSDLIKFDMNRARMAQQELERAIDFAADVAGGGSVVVHTGEYDRPLTDMYLLGEERNLSEGPDGRIMFKKRLTEDKDARFFLIDDRTGQAMSTVEKDRMVAYPVWKKAENDQDGVDNEDNPCQINKGDYIDYEGRKIIDPYDPARGRVPVFDEKSGEFRTEYLSYDDFKDIADEKNEIRERLLGKKLSDYEKTSQTEAYLQATLETNEGHSRGWSGQYASDVRNHLEQLDKLNKAKEFYEKLDESISPDEKWKLALSDPKVGGAVGQLIPPDTKQPLELINEQIKDLRFRINFERQSSGSQLQQAEDTAETKEHIKEPIKYLERFAVRGYTEAALHAMDRSVNPDNPIVITMENIFPDRFGGHPQELKWLIEKAREKFVEHLTEPEIELGLTTKEKPVMKKNPETGKLELQKQPNPWYRESISKEKAEELAATHIKATLDTGHLNMWRKFFQPKQGSTAEQNEAEFKKWYLDQIDDLAKNKMIGNVHLADNFGYQDDHLAPGQGNTPIKEAVQIIKKYGYDKALTVEPGADASTDISDFHGVMKTWRYFGSSIYGMGAPAQARQTWGQVEHSYFGQNQPPYFVFGAYSPSNEWTLWSQVPME